MMLLSLPVQLSSLIHTDKTSGAVSALTAGWELGSPWPRQMTCMPLSDLKVRPEMLGDPAQRSASMPLNQRPGAPWRALVPTWAFLWWTASLPPGAAHTKPQLPAIATSALPCVHDWLPASRTVPLGSRSAVVGGGPPRTGWGGGGGVRGGSSASAAWPSVLQ